MARSLGLITNTYENEELVQEVVLSSLFCVILRDYIFPDELITNILADTKLVAFYLLLKKAGLENTIKEKHIDFHIQEKVKNKSSEETDILDYVVISMEVLSKNFPDFYHVFEMRYIEGLTGAQIQRLLELRGSSRSLEDIAKNTGEALKQLRIFFHQLWETQKFDEETKRKWLKTTDVQKIQVTRPFEKPGSLKNDIETLKELEGFLQESRFNWPLDFGLGEFDHIAGHDIDRQLDREKIREIQKKIAKNITKELGVKLPKYLESLKAELLFCGNNLQDIKNILMSFIKEEFSLDLDEQFFLKEKLGAYHNDKHLLKRD
jgi:hypothetical protein